MTEPTYTPEELAAAAAQVQPPPVGTTLGAVPPGGSATEVDVAALMARMDAMAAQLAALQAEKAGASGEHSLVDAAVTAKDLIAQHFEFHPKLPELTRLADDLIDAARNAVSSGDTSATRTVADKLRRRLEFFSPGPGDHHYYRQALGMVTTHVPDQADTVTEAQPSNAPALGSSQAPAKVVAGSVTG